MLKISGYLRKVISIGVHRHPDVLNQLRQRTVNIVSSALFAVTFLLIPIRLASERYALAGMLAMSSCLALASLFLGAKGKLRAAISVSCITLTGLTFFIAFFDLLKPALIIPQYVLTYVMFLVIIRNKTVKFLYSALCLGLIWILFFRNGFTWLEASIFTSNCFGFSLVFNYFTIFLESFNQALITSNNNLLESNRNQEELNLTLLDKNDELRTFSHIMSHDLKSPLRTIISFSKLVKRRTNFDDKENEEYLDFIVNSANSMNTLIEDLLVFSNVDSEAAAEFKRVDLNELTHKLISNYQFEIIKNEVKFNVGILPLVLGNEQLLSTLLNNLITNGLKYQPKDKPRHIPTISIYSLEDCDEPEIIVEDNGIGINPEYVDNLFVPFKRFHNSSEYEGTGLGMSICRKVMQKHKGLIELAHTSKSGSKFRIKFSSRTEN